MTEAMCGEQTYMYTGRLNVRPEVQTNTHIPNSYEHIQIHKICINIFICICIRICICICI